MHDESDVESDIESNDTTVDPAFAFAPGGGGPSPEHRRPGGLDDGYWSAFRRLESVVRQQLAAGRRHLFEAEMKEVRQVRGGSRPASP